MDVKKFIAAEPKLLVISGVESNEHLQILLDTSDICSFKFPFFPIFPQILP